MRLPVRGGEMLQKLYKFFEKYMLFILLIAAGALIVFWDSGGAKKEEPATAAEYAAFSLADMEAKLARALQHIEGAGRVEVVLTLKTDMEVVFAQDSSFRSSRDLTEGTLSSEDKEEEWKTLVVGSSQDQSPVIVKRIYPLYRGVLVICDGGNDAAVRLRVMDAVSAVTGLRTDAITITGMAS